ncbi:MAG: glycosyltransferase [Desulfobulbus sp.]|jgi:glycosyltransferase involved in cell wall biosynthesis
MNVLHLYRTYFPDPPGGLQEAIRQIALATRLHGANVRIFTLSPNPRPERLHIDDIEVIRARSLAAPGSCDLGGRDALHRFPELADWADIIHFHFPWPFADVLNLVARPARPKVMTYHSDIVRQRFMGALYRPLMQRTLSDMNAVVATSPPYIPTSPVLSRQRPGKRLRVIPLGIEESTYPTQCDDAILSRLGLAENVPFILFIGVLRYYKGLHTLVQAAAAIKGTVVIAGSGPEAAAIREQARRLGADNVVFAGQVTDAEKIALLRACRALVLPSHLRSEAYGMVLVEASMFGKPMVSCEIGTGTSFVNQHEETGFVTPPEDADALARAMNRLLSDAELAQQFGTAARERYEHLFSGSVMGAAYTSLYNELT